MHDAVSWRTRSGLATALCSQLVSTRHVIAYRCQAQAARRGPRQLCGHRKPLTRKVAASHLQNSSPGDEDHQSPVSPGSGNGARSPAPGTYAPAAAAAAGTNPQPPSELSGDAGSGQGKARLSSFQPVGASPSARGTLPSRIQLALSTATFALPLAAQNILGYSLNALSESLVGRLGPTSLSASTLANSSYSLAGLSLVWGGAAGMETLCGQAYGAGNLRLMRLVLIRAVMVCWGVCFPVVALWGNAEPLLLALGQSPALVAQAAVYLKALAPAMYWYILSECLQTYLVVQGLVRPAVVAKAVVTLLGPLFYYGCMFWLDLGLVGAGYAYGLCKGTNAVLLLGYLAWRWLRGPSEPEGEQGDPPAAAAAGATGSNPGDVDNSSGSKGKERLTIQGPVRRKRSGGDAAAAAVPESSDTAASGRTSFSAVYGFKDGAGKSGWVGLRPDAHEEVLTSPLSAAASAHEFSIRTTPAVNARAAPAAATAAAVAVTTAAKEGLHDRLRRAAAAVRAEAAEVLDARAVFEYVKFGLPAAVMSCLEWWAYEALVIMAGWLPDAHVSVGCLGICLTVSGWVYMVPQAIATAACTRVSNALGAGEAELAKRTFQAAYGLVLLCQLAVSSCLLPNAARVAAFFCPDPLAAALTATLLPITALNVIGDGLNCVLNGILRACGRQSLGARLHLLAYWCCGLPAAYAAAFHLGLGVRGFVVAIGVTSFVQSLVVGAVISRFDWEGEVRNSQALLSTISSTSSVSSIELDEDGGEDQNQQQQQQEEERDQQGQEASRSPLSSPSPSAAAAADAAAGADGKATDAATAADHAAGAQGPTPETPAGSPGGPASAGELNGATVLSPASGR